MTVREKTKGSGEWWIFINHNGLRRSKKIGQDKRLAFEAAKKIEARLVLGEMGLSEAGKTDPAVPTMNEYSRLWLEDYIKPLRRASTYERYSWVYKKYVKPYLGKQPIDQVKRGDIRNLLLKHYKAGLSRSSVCIIRDCVSGIMGHALDEELIAANPVKGITKKLQLERTRRIEAEPFNQSEVDQVLHTCSESFPDYYPFFLCAFRTGMRLGELLGLQWGDIDWNGQFITVRRSFKNRRLEKPKNGKTRRVDMSDQLIEVMRGLQTNRKREALKDGRGVVVDWIFHKGGEPIAQNSIRNVWNRLLLKAGIRRNRLHDIRHTYASLLLSNGQSPVYVKEQLGHSSIQITVDVYGHLIPSSNRDAVNQLDQPHLSAPYTHPVKSQKP